MTDLYKLLRRPVALLDFETTGLNPKQDRVIEIACVLHDQHGRHEFEMIVRPDPIPDPLDEFVTERSGISREMIEAGVPSHDAFCSLFAFVVNADIVVGHNLAKFDLAFWKSENGRHEIMDLPLDFIDTMVLAQFTKSGVRHINRGGYPYLATTLADVREFLSIPLEGAHRAMNDVRAVEAVLPDLYRAALSMEKPILNAMVHPAWLIDRGQPRPEYVPPRAIVYNVA